MKHRLARLAAPLGLGLGLGLALLTAVTPAAVAQDAAVIADERYQTQDWDEAAALYRELAIRDPSAGRNWYRLGVSLGQLGRPREALEALDKALAAGIPVSYVDFERARIAAAGGDGQTALDLLDKAVAGGFTQFERIEDDPHLAALAGNPRLGALVAKARAARYPCENSPEHRQFDFWIGDWEVRTADGTLAGHNRISRREHGCLLLEEWTSASGGTGASMNFYDPRKGQWVQVWNSADGTLIEIAGNPESGSMVLRGQIHYLANGTTAPFRGTWTPQPDGRVRQFFEQSADDGQTWSPWFEGYYTRTATTPAP